MSIAEMMGFIVIYCVLERLEGKFGKQGIGRMVGPVGWAALMLLLIPGFGVLKVVGFFLTEPDYDVSVIG